MSFKILNLVLISYNLKEWNPMENKIVKGKQERLKVD